jgi:glucose/arabinose dehydrogenase
MTAVAFVFAAPAYAAKPDPQTAQQPPAPEGKVKLKQEVLAEGLANPWSLAFLPDGQILVTERPGRLRVISGGALAKTPVAGLPQPYVANQAGTFEVLPHPDFATNRTLFISYAHGTRQANATRVISATFDGAALSNIRTVFEARPLKDKPVHYGGRLAYLPDGTMLVTLGDGFDYRERAQTLDNGFGKIVRINLDGSFPKDNPFTERKGALPEIWSYGHRNVQGLAVDPATGAVYETEHGPKGGDELNLVQKGKNYGWPIACYCLDYSGARVTPFTAAKGTEQPLKYWTPSIGPSGLAVYRGALFADWQGDLLAGGMAGNASQGVSMQGLHRIIMRGGKPVGEERYLTGVRIREVRVGPDGAIYVTTEDRGGGATGKVIRLTPQ